LPTTIVDQGGIVVSKSTDGGLTWSDPVLAGTPLDRPKLTADLSAGVIYGSSTGTLGRLFTGDPTTVGRSLKRPRLLARRTRSTYVIVIPWSGLAVVGATTGMRTRVTKTLPAESRGSRGQMGSVAAE